MGAGTASWLCSSLPSNRHWPVYISFADRASRRDEPSSRGKGATRVSSVVVSLGVVSLLTDISSESVAAILPLYLTGVLGLTMVAYGFIDGIYQGISAIVRIGGGWLSDRTDRPKWVAFAGYGVSAMARVWLIFASGFGSVVGVVAVDRLGKGLRTAPRDAMITASSDPAILGRSFGVHRMLDTIGAAIGPLLAFLILLLIPTGYGTVFVLSAACALLGVLMLGVLVPGRIRRPGTDVAESGGVARSPFRWRSLAAPELRKVLIVAGVFGLCTVGDGFIYLVLQSNTDFAAAWFPLLYVGTNAVFLALAVPLGRLADRYGRGRMFVLGHAALLAAYLCALAPIAGMMQTVSCLVLLGTFYAATDGVLAALAAGVAPQGGTASGLAAAQTVVALARFLASTLFGVLWFALGPAMALAIFAVAIGLAIPIGLVLLRQPVAERNRS
ncbi:MFS transporter [Cryobacterium sp. AP23]